MKVNDLSEIGTILSEKMREDSLNLHKLGSINPKFKRNTINKVLDGEGNVIFQTVLDIVEFSDYELQLVKKKKNGQ